MDIIDRSKRLFVLGGAVGGIAMLLDYLPRTARWDSAAANKIGDVPKAMGHDRLLSQAREILEAFQTAKSGPLMAHYQNSFPALLNEPGLKAISDVAASEIANPTSDLNPHRVMVLPATFAIHGIANSDNNFLHAANSTILNVHRDAFDNNYNREILEIIWQNITAAIIRNELSWRTISLDDEIVNDAAEICFRYLDGEFMLLMASVNAFQALLTYRMALEERAQNSFARRVSSIIESICIREAGTNSRWFVALNSIIRKRREWSQALPQLNEILIGHKAFDGEIANFAIAMRLKHFSQMSSIARGERSSVYQSTDRAKKHGKSLPLLVDYQVTPSTWNEVRANANGTLSDTDICELNEIFSQYEFLLKSADDSYLREGADAASMLAKRVPFRNGPEGSIFATLLATDSAVALTLTKGFATGLPRIVFAAEHLQNPSERPTREQNLRISQYCDSIYEEFPSLTKATVDQFDEALEELSPSAVYKSTPVGSGSSHSRQGGGALSDKTENRMTPRAMAVLESWKKILEPINQKRAIDGLPPISMYESSSAEEDEQFDTSVREATKAANLLLEKEGLDGGEPIWAEWLDD